LVTATEKAGDTEIRANVPVIFCDKGIGLGVQMFVDSGSSCSRLLQPSTTAAPKAAGVSNVCGGKPPNKFARAGATTTSNNSPLWDDKGVHWRGKSSH
jgi:hypothetical protein